MSKPYLSARQTKWLPAINITLCIFILAMNMLALLAPTITETHGIWLILAFDILLLRLTNLQWHLIHEAAHRVLLPSPFWNETIGRILSLFFFSSFTVLRFGHLVHHQTNRFEDLTEVYDKRPHTLMYYADILGGFYYVTEFLAPMVSLLPHRVRTWVFQYTSRQMSAKEKTVRALIRLHENTKKILTIRLECLAYLALLAFALNIYQNHLALFVAYFALRATLVAYYNNMPHYGNSVNVDTNAADNSYLPKWLSLLYLNFNYHRVHHQNPLAPWIALPDLFKQKHEPFDKSLLKSFFRQLAGPIALDRLSHKH